MKRSSLRRVSKKQAIELRRRDSLRQVLLVRSGGRCEICHKPADWRGLSLHHVKYLSHGGKTEESNCVLACGSCHSERHNIREV